MHALGIAAAFGINSASYLALVAGLLVVRVRPQVAVPREESRLRASLRFVWERAFLGLRPLASLVDGTLAGAFGVRVAGVCLALPALAAAAVILRLRDRPVGHEQPAEA